MPKVATKAMEKQLALALRDTEFNFKFFYFDIFLINKIDTLVTDNVFRIFLTQC